jgi:hypothetical protein
MKSHNQNGDNKKDIVEVSDGLKYTPDIVEVSDGLKYKPDSIESNGWFEEDIFGINPLLLLGGVGVIAAIILFIIMNS